MRKSNILGTIQICFRRATHFVHTDFQVRAEDLPHVRQSFQTGALASPLVKCE